MRTKTIVTRDLNPIRESLGCNSTSDAKERTPTKFNSIQFNPLICYIDPCTFCCMGLVMHVHVLRNLLLVEWLAVVAVPTATKRNPILETKIVWTTFQTKKERISTTTC